ncbi:MAG: DCC1-like thiol-disulfide oxidoreductase family protein [Cytophagaceae bacterium]
MSDQRKILVYDGDCRVCVGLVKLLHYLSLLSENVETTAYSDVPAQVGSEIDKERFRTEVAVVSQAGTEYGIKGIRNIISPHTWLGKLLNIPLIFPLFIFCYKLISFNRFVIATPYNEPEDCGCNQTREEYFYKLVYLILSASATLIILAGTAITFNGIFYNLGKSEVLIRSFLLFGAAGFVQLFMVLTIYRFHFFDYIGHFFTVGLAASLFFIPWIIISMFYKGDIVLAFFIFCFILSFTVIHYRRLKYLQFPLWLNFPFWLVLITGIFVIL